MAKQSKIGRNRGRGPRPDRGPGNFDVKSHHELWARLAHITQMHGHPGQRKGKSGG